MRKKQGCPALIFSFLLFAALPAGLLFAQDLRQNPTLDEKVQKFLDAHTYQWHDMNVPARDGKFLHDLIIRHHYKRALEIGTSTGHSGIWLAWALSKTGGKLITIEIDEDRYRQAVNNFKEAGLAEYVDARLADAHDLVPKLEGPFDFVFCDADKDWYKNYFIAISPKLKVGGCFTAHNVSMRGWGPRGFVDYIKNQSNYETTIEQTSTTGISLSYKKSDQVRPIVNY